MQIALLTLFASIFLIVLFRLDKNFIKEANEAADKTRRFYQKHNPIL